MLNTIEPWMGAVNEYHAFQEGQSEDKYNDTVRRHTRFMCRESATELGMTDHAGRMAIESGLTVYYKGWPGFYWREANESNYNMEGGQAL
jgi:hypothetical protein